MAMTADSAQGHQTHNHTHPASSVAVSGGTDGVNSPSQKKTLPWAQVVRGEPDAVTTPSSPEQQKSDDTPSPPPLPVAAAAEAAEVQPKPAAWKRPSLPNGSTESVMGAISWPALSESTKASSKSDSFPIALPESSEGSVTQHPPGPGRSNPVQKNTATARQRSMKKGGSSSSDSSAGVHLQNNFSNQPVPPPPPTFPGYQMHTNGPALLDVGEPSYRPRTRTVGGFVPQPPAANDHRHSSKRGNFGPRGDGPHQNNSRRENDRPHYGNTRDNGMQRGSPRGYVRAPPPPPPSAATYVHPQPMRPFNPMAYPEIVYVPALPMEPYRGVPFIAPPMRPPFIIPVPEPLSATLVHQIDYYFSDANLVKDEFLKSNMDNQGWVPITLIAGFRRVKSMTNNIQVILESLRTSTVVEIQDDKIRRRNDWMNWIPGSSKPQTDSSPPSSTVSSGHDPLTTSTQRMSLEDAAANQNTAAAEPSSLTGDASGSRSSETVSPQGAA